MFAVTDAAHPASGVPAPSPAVPPSLEAIIAAAPAGSVVLVIQLPHDPPQRLPGRWRADADDEDLLSCAALASRYRLSAEALRKRLQRWQAGRLDGWVEVENPTRNQPRFLYRVGSVRHLFAGLTPATSVSLAG